MYSHIFEKYKFYHYTSNTTDISLQRAYDYVQDPRVNEYYLCWDWRMTTDESLVYENISSIAHFGYFITTDISINGIKSPLNLFKNVIHPGMKRYIISKYCGLTSIPILEQTLVKHKKIPDSAVEIKSIDDIYQLYGDNISIQLKDDDRLEVSWHGITENRRDRNGYDDWYGYAMSNFGSILGNFKQHSINTDLSDFIVEVDESLKNYDLRNLYFHFDPRYVIKECMTKKIRIINRNPTQNLETKNVNLYTGLTGKAYENN